MTPPTRRCRATIRVVPAVLPLLAVLAVGGLGACSHPIGSTADRAGASPKAMAACRQRADEVWERQNRGEVYRNDTFATAERDSPFGAGGMARTDPGAGLPDRYARETMLDDCLNAASGTPGTTPDAPPPAGLAPDAAPPGGHPAE